MAPLANAHMNDPKTPAQRKADERERQRLAGRVMVTVWVHPDDRARVQRYAERANRQRAADPEKM